MTCNNRHPNHSCEQSPHNCDDSSHSCLIAPEHESYVQAVEEHYETIVDANRRKFLHQTVTGALAFAAFGVFGHPLLADARNKERMIELYVPRTGEVIRSVFWTPTDGYISESIAELSVAMRDGRTDEVKRINTKTLDIIAALQRILGPKQPTHLISGYRSPVTNRRIGGAKESYHVKAMASDLKMPDVQYSRLLSAAYSLNAGGVGKYTRSNFVHVDSGPVRQWGSLDGCSCSDNSDLA